MAEAKQKLKLDFWKPNKSGSGCGAIFDLNAETGNLFMTMMPQNGEKSFDSKAKITAKLGRTDVGEFLSVLLGRNEGLGAKDGDRWKGLYHKNNTGNAIIGLSPDKDGRYWLSLSVDKSGTKSRLNCGVTVGEMVLLTEFFRQCLPVMFTDTYKNPQETAEATE